MDIWESPFRPVARPSTAASTVHTTADIQSLGELLLETTVTIMAFLTYGLEILWNILEKTA
jgi:hypothetical protein